MQIKTIRRITLPLMRPMNWWLAHYQAGYICSLKGEYNEAIRYFSGAVALRGDKAVGYLALACMYSRTRQYKEAIDQLVKVESNNSFVKSYENLEDIG